jgi:hypothetical protein
VGGADTPTLHGAFNLCRIVRRRNLELGDQSRRSQIVMKKIAILVASSNRTSGRV